VTQGNASLFVSPLHTAEQEDGRQPERYGHDWLIEVLFVPILMKRQLGTRIVPIDETGIGVEVGEPSFARRISRQPGKHVGQRWPRPTTFGIDWIVPVAAAIRQPTDRAAVRQGDRHAKATRRDHVPKGRCRCYLSYGLEQRTLLTERESAKHDRTGPQALAPARVSRLIK
jgi:hypothetical protein